MGVKEERVSINLFRLVNVGIVITSCVCVLGGVGDNSFVL